MASSADVGWKDGKPRFISSRMLHKIDSIVEKADFLKKIYASESCSLNADLLAGSRKMKMEAFESMNSQLVEGFLDHEVVQMHHCRQAQWITRR